MGRLLCCLISTIDYCITSSKEQTLKILKHVNIDELREQVSFEAATQQLLVTRSIGITNLVNCFWKELDPIFATFSKIQWQAQAQTIDPSSFFIRTCQFIDSASKVSPSQSSKFLQPLTCSILFENFLQ